MLFRSGEDIKGHATGKLELATGGKPCTWSQTAAMQLDRHSDGTYAVLSLAADCGKAPMEALQVKYGLLFDVDPSHRGLVQWLAPGSQTAQALIFSKDSAAQTLTLQPPSALETLRQYVVEGVWHIWIGFDHILFLLSLLLPAVLVWIRPAWQPVPRLRDAVIDVAKIVTAFTVAHSITLSLAALGMISLPSRLVESVIAASVVLVAAFGTGDIATLNATAHGPWAMVAATVSSPPSHRNQTMPIFSSSVSGLPSIVPLTIDETSPSSGLASFSAMKARR